MSARINTILIIGATRGIGEAMARRFHSMGKKVIAAGISQDKLTKLAQELPGLETRTVRLQLDGTKKKTVRSYELTVCFSLSLSLTVGRDRSSQPAKPRQGHPSRFPHPRHRLHQRRDPKPLHDPPASGHGRSRPRGHDEPDRPDPDFPVLRPAPRRPGPVGGHQDDPLPHQLLPGVLPVGFLPDVLRHQGRRLGLRQDCAHAVGFRGLQGHECSGGCAAGTLFGHFFSFFLWLVHQVFHSSRRTSFTITFFYSNHSDSIPIGRANQPPEERS